MGNNEPVKKAKSTDDWFSYLDVLQQHQQKHEKDREGRRLVKCPYKHDYINIQKVHMLGACVFPARLPDCRPIGNLSSALCKQTMIGSLSQSW